MGYCEDRDDENNPRNAAAIRTAILLGASFRQDVVPPVGTAGIRNMWYVDGVYNCFNSKAMAAFMFLIPFGIGIDKDANPKLFKDINNGDGNEGLPVDG